MEHVIGNLGASEIVLILAVALIVFGPRKLPEIGRSFGKTLHEFRKASFSSLNNLESEIKEAEIKETAAKKEAEAQKIQAIAGPTPTDDNKDGENAPEKDA